jgi:hypothetical protein
MDPMNHPDIHQEFFPVSYRHSTLVRSLDQVFFLEFFFQRMKY